MTWNRRQFVKQSVLGVLAGLGRRAPTFAVAIPQSSSGLRASTGASGHRRRVDSIDWYYELRGQGRAIVLIPSGEGDCGSFEKVATLLSSAFKVLTFDMPGFSRSREPPGFANYSMDQAAAEVAGLVRALKLEPATFYGCSSSSVAARCRSFGPRPRRRRPRGVRPSTRAVGSFTAQCHDSRPPEAH